MKLPPPPITPENPTGKNLMQENPPSQPLIKNEPLSWIIRVVISGIILSSFIRSWSKSTQINIMPATPTSTIVNSPDNWEIYTDELDTYQIQAPPDWEWITHSSNFQDMHFITLKAPDGSVFQSAATKTDTPTLTQYLQERDQKNTTDWEGQPSKNIISSKNVIIGDHSAIERTEQWLAADYSTIVTYIKIGSYIFNFSIEPSEIEYAQSEVFKNYHQIISTFIPLSVSPTPIPQNQFCGGIAGIACPPGFECKLDGKYPDSGGVCIQKTLIATPPPSPETNVGLDCKIGGCSGELCLDKSAEDVASICIYKDEYACYKYAVCEKQSDGQCAWTQTPEFQSCIENLGQ